MRKYLIDSDVLINYSKGIEADLNFIENNYKTSFISFISFAEVIQGARNKNDLKNLKSLLAPLEIIYIEVEIQNLSLMLLEEFNLKQGLILFDSLIAASALFYELTLVTYNNKQFKNIIDLEVTSPVKL